MPGNFLDSNVVLYVASGDPVKAERAEKLIADGGTISVQVLNEIANVCRRKLRLGWPETRELLALICGLLRVEPLTLEIHHTGLDLAQHYGLAVYDAMIAAAALHAGCDTLLSEDFQDRLLIRDKLRVVNPFAVR